MAAILLADLRGVSLLREIASLLVLEDPLQPAAAIVVLNGGMPTREIEAARLYRAGLARKVVTVKGTEVARSGELEGLGVPVEESWRVSREVLLRQGVVASDILVLIGEPRSTLEELKIVADALLSKNEPVILVTSPFHTRRTGLIWKYLTKAHSRPIVRVASRESFEVDRWWKRRELAWSVVHEYLGLANYYLGFPVSS
jgi:uncharacterized SAM-binding protein YcdF (DUF218 family)